MLGQLFLKSCLVMMTSCWRIDVSEKNVAMQLSLNVTLDCRNHDDNNSPKLAQITKLGILKRKPNNHWVKIAKVEGFPPHIMTSLQNVMITGNASNCSNSFIKLQFPFATDDAIGQFVCEVEGYYTGDGVSERVVKTKPVVIAQRKATYQDMLKIIIQFQQQNKIKNVNEHILFVLLQKMINLHNRDIEKINNRTIQLTEDIKSIAKKNPSQVWPTGRYTLLQTDTGCPFSSTFDWQFRSVRITTKPGRGNNDKMFTPSHLSLNIFEHVTTTNHHYVNLEMCSKSVPVEGPAWPKGSYCIGYYRFNCPEGFYRGTIRVGRYDDGSRGDVRVNDPSSWGNKLYTLQNYCCRRDGNANTPIELPTREPFYLYRHHGTCQKVKGMDASNEWIQLDTNPKYDNKWTGTYVPDGHMKPVRHELCYYKPSV